MTGKEVELLPATLNQAPDPDLNFSGNIPDLVMSNVIGAEELILYLGEEKILSEVYSADPEKRITIVLKDILEETVPNPGCEAGVMAIPAYRFTFGSFSGSFKCIRGGHGAQVPATTFCKHNFLSWQPQACYTYYHTPQFLRYVALDQAVCKVKAYFKDGTTSTVQLGAVLDTGYIHTIDVSFGIVRGKFSEQPIYYDVWVENASAEASYVQRYVLVETLPGTDDFFVFENSLGGFDTIRFSGDRKQTDKLESLTALFGEHTYEYDIDRLRSWQKYTGYFATEHERQWALDFFNSTNRYHLDEGVLRQIYVSKPKLEATAKEVTGYEFTYAYTRQSKYMSLPRVETPELLEIIAPDEEVFFLAPRLNHFEWIDLSDDILIPVQRIHDGKWYALPAMLLRQAVDGVYGILDRLAELFHPKEGRIGLDMKAKDLQAVGTTTTKNLVVTGTQRSEDFVSGITGIGYQVDSAGNGEYDSLTVRRFLEVPELRYNRVDISVGDKWRSPGGGLIEAVDIEHQEVTLKLEEGEIGAVAAGDICMGIFHSQNPVENAVHDSNDGKGNRTFAGFFTVYFTVLEVLDERRSRFKYQLRETSDAYPRYFQPVPFMNFVAYGNFINEERQSSVYETRTYSRHLVGVNDWDFTKENVAAQYGDLSNLSIFGIDMQGYSAYLDRVYMRGTIYQINATGEEIPVPSFVGLWENGVEYKYYDVVSYNGELWKCDNSLGTSSEPSIENDDWENWTLTAEKGEEGVSSYMHIKYSNDGGETFSENNGDKPGMWMGHYVDSNPQDSIKPSDYKWSKIQGDPGLIPAGRWSSLKNPYMASSMVTLARASFVAKRMTDQTPVGLLKSGNNYLVSGEGYILRGPMPDFMDTENWDLYIPPPVDGEDGEDGKDGKDGADGKDGKDGKDGANGLQGMIVRQSEWAAGVEYRNDVNEVSSIRYLDVVVITSGSSFSVYQCKPGTHVSSSLNMPPNTTYWQEFNMMQPVYTALLLAQNAVIRFMQGQQIVVQDDQGNIVGGLSGKAVGDLIWPLWAGLNGPANAPFRVDQNGRLIATNAEVSGKITATSGRIGGFNIEGSTLKNDFNDEQAAVIFRNDPKKIFAAIGTNVVSAGISDGIPARFENQGTNPFGENVALRVTAAGGGRNTTIAMDGGSISGFAIHVQQVTGDLTLTHAQCYLSCRNTNVITLTLPPVAEAVVGKVYYIRVMALYSVAVFGNMYTDAPIDAIAVPRGNTAMLVNDGQFWCVNYMKHTTP